MQDPLIRKYLKAARRRFTSAEILYRNYEYFDAVYLAGYVPECALKALCLARVPLKHRADFEKQNLITHSYEELKALLRQCGVNIPVQVVEHLVKVRTWRTAMRYESGPGDPAEAEEFLEAAKAVLDWVERSI